MTDFTFKPVMCLLRLVAMKRSGGVRGGALFSLKDFSPDVEEFDSSTAGLQVDSASNGVRTCRGPNLRRLERWTQCKPIREAPVRGSCLIKPRSPNLPIISVRSCQNPPRCISAVRTCQFRTDGGHPDTEPAAHSEKQNKKRPWNYDGVKHPFTGVM